MTKYPNYNQLLEAENNGDHGEEDTNHYVCYKCDTSCDIERAIDFEQIKVGDKVWIECEVNKNDNNTKEIRISDWSQYVLDDALISYLHFRYEDIKKHIPVETIEIEGKKYLKSDFEKAIKKLKPIE